MITLTESAVGKLKELFAEENNPNLLLRVFVQGGGCSGFQYGFTFDQDRNEDEGNKRRKLACHGVQSMKRKSDKDFTQAWAIRLVREISTFNLSGRFPLWRGMNVWTSSAMEIKPELLGIHSKCHGKYSAACQKSKNEQK